MVKFGRTIMGRGRFVVAFNMVLMYVSTAGADVINVKQRSCFFVRKFPNSLLLTYGHPTIRLIVAFGE